MEELVIRINIFYFLGVVGTLLILAWQLSARLSAMKADIAWLKDSFRDLKIENDNAKLGVFEASSPVDLTARGEAFLRESGLKHYIDENQDMLLELCEREEDENAYEAQETAFDLFEALRFDGAFEERLKTYAFNHGISMEILRRIGALYFRNIYLEHLGFASKGSA